jgi:NAD(P)-dependent dehydrogenase (short-subunit alcohol dehydrogenase family)
VIVPTVLITGCDAGIGREFARQYAAAGWQVLATYRDLANRLPDQPEVRHFALDMAALDQFAAMRAAIGAEPVDVLLSNAGIGHDAMKLGAIDFDRIKEIYAVNTVGALKLVDTFLDNVVASGERKLVFISSRMGSIGSNLSGGAYGYRASKAALNAIARSLAIDLFPRGIIVSVLHPGRVATAGGGPGAPVAVEDSVAGMRRIVRDLGNHETGQFYTYAGMPLPW